MRIHFATSTGPELRKVYEAGPDGPKRLESEEGFQRWNEFDLWKYDVDDLAQLRDLLEKQSNDPCSTIILGEPTLERQGHSADEFRDYRYDLFFADVDGFQFDGTVEEAILDLFPFLTGKEFVFYYSPSAGIKSGWRLRVIWRISLTVADQHEYAISLNEQISLRKGLFRKWVDTSIYHLGGFIFTSRPDLRGIDDPHPVRAFHVEGDKTPETFSAPKDMVEIAVTGQRGKPTLHWDSGQRHNSVFNFWRQYRDANGPDATWVEAWQALSAEYDRLSVPAKDRREFGEIYTRKKFPGVKGSRRTTRAFRQQYDPMPLDEAQHRLTDAMRRAIGDRDTPRLTGIRITAGGGKSTAALRQLGVEKRYMDDLGFTFMADYYVPTHRLGDELALKAQTEGLDAVVEKGRSQEVNSEPVCFKHEAAKELNGVVSDVSAHLCGNEELGFCSKFDTCVWRDIKARSKTCDLRIRPHDFLSLKAEGENNENRRQVDVVVIDEDPISSLLHHGSVEIKELCDVTRHNMSDWLLRFYQVVEEGLTLDALDAAGFTPDICAELIKAESNLKPQVDVTPDMDDEQSLKGAQKYDRHWWKYESVWRRLLDCLEARSLNRLRISKDKTKLLTNWASIVSAIPVDEDGRVKVQTVLMSATMDRSTIEQFFYVDEWVEIDVQKHDDSIVRQANAPGSKAALLYGTGDREEEYGETNASKKVAAEKLRADVARIVGDENLFTFKGVADLSDTVTGWFNGVEGVDEVVQFSDLLPEELAYKVAPIRTTSWGLAKRLFKKFKDTPKSSFRYQVDDVYHWATENRAEFAEVRFEGERQWSRVFVAGWQGWDALERLGMVDQRLPKQRKDDDEAKFRALIEQNRWLVEPDAVDVLREAFEREAWIDDEGVMPEGDVTLEQLDGEVDIGQLARDVRPEWPWQFLNVRNR